MWVLVVHGRQYWLLPGKQYTIGRTTKNAESAVDIVIQESSVSRKHLVLEVVAATEDAILHPSIRSELYLTDLASRFGTKLDGHALTAHERTAVPLKASDSVTLKIGSFATAELKWKNFIVSYATGQSGEAHETIWNHALNMLRPLDVKLLPYVVKKTSVLVKAGVTTSTVYFALASCIPVVNSQFLQALHNAAIEASATGVKGTIIPDMKPFNPDPAWRPDPRRRNCLAGQSFHSPDEQHAAALRPIIEAAGGLYTDTCEKDTFLVCQNEADLQKCIPGAQYIQLTSVFSAINDYRGIEPGDIQKKSGAGRSKRSMIREEPNSEPKRVKVDSPQQTQASRRPRRERVNFFSALTSSQPSSQQTPAQPNQPSQPAIPSPGSNSSSKQGRLDYDSDATTQSRAQPPQGVPLPEKRQAKETSAKSAPARKRARKNTAKPPAHETDIAAPFEEPELDVENLAISDYSTIGELAVVDASMDTKREKRLPPAQPDPSWAARPNFKGFRKSTRTPNTRKVDYDADIPDDTPFDDEFAAPTPSPSTSSSLRQALRAGTPVSRELEDDSDESIFVSSEPTNSALRNSLSRSGAITDLSNASDRNNNVADDGFSFSFS